MPEVYLGRAHSIQVYIHRNVGAVEEDAIRAGVQAAYLTRPRAEFDLRPGDALALESAGGYPDDVADAAGAHLQNGGDAERLGAAGVLTTSPIQPPGVGGMGTDTIS